MRTEDDIRRQTVRDVLDLFESEWCDFYHNEPNNYGCIDLKLWTGEGDPKRFMGEQVQANFADGRRGTGNYKMNDALVDLVLEQISKEPPCGK